MFGAILLTHLLGATVWTGGHLILALTVLPRALRERDPAVISSFELGFERIGIPALAIQVVTGLWLAHRLVPDVGHWFDPAHPVGRVIGLKLGLLAATVVLAIDARLRIIPGLRAETLGSLALHIVPVTVSSVLFVVVGASFRIGWFY